jgi:hypothetical protein
VNHLRGSTIIFSQERFEILESINIPNDVISLHLNRKYLFGIPPDDPPATHVADDI